MPKRKSPSDETSLSRYDVTIPLCDSFPDEHAVHELFQAWANKYVFQKERGDTGYLHWQCRINLIKPKRYNALKTSSFLKIGRFCPTSNPEFRKSSFSYVMKADTRVAGPYSDEDFVKRPPKTIQLQAFMECPFYPWQKDVYDMASVYDERTIKIIYDKAGNAGKSILCEYMEYKGVAVELPPFRAMEDIMAVVLAMPISKCYIIDLPRGMKKDKLAEFYSGIEVLKNGKAFDKRYSYRSKRFDRPQVVVFTNVLPELSLMSLDRWEFWELLADKTLRMMAM